MTGGGPALLAAGVGVVGAAAGIAVDCAAASAPEIPVGTAPTSGGSTSSPGTASCAAVGLTGRPRGASPALSRSQGFCVIFWIIARLNRPSGATRLMVRVVINCPFSKTTMCSSVSKLFPTHTPLVKPMSPLW